MSEKHLFVLVHGLWGNYKHMDSIKGVFSKTFGDENVIFFAPKQNGYFKTFDGIEIVGYRTLLELCEFIRKYGVGKITKISFIGYSMGGLISRFIIGKMETECQELFEGIDRQLFITFATPHLGVEFYLPKEKPLQTRSRRFLHSVLSFLGSTVLGRSGRQLFIRDKHSWDSTLVKLSSDEYLLGLSAFKYRICIANVKNDRTVAFYTAFITDCDPFIQTQNRVHYSFETDLPCEGLHMLPRIVDLDKLDPEDHHPPKPYKWYTKVAFGALICAILCFALPVVLVTNILGTCYSYIATIHYQKVLRRGNGSALIRRKLGLEDKVEDMLRGTVGEILNREDKDEQVEESIVRNDATTWNDFISKYSNVWKSPTGESFQSLPLDSNRKRILANLNKLTWIRIPMYIKSFNAHDGIVGRKGIENASPYSLAGLQFVSQLAKYLLSKDSI